MGNAIATFPVPALGQWNYRWPVKKTPSYKTLIQTPASNVAELRVSLTPYPIWIFELDVSYFIGNPIGADTAYRDLVGLYGQMQGAAGQFYYQDPYDFQVQLANCTPAKGDGTTTLFVMTRQVGGLQDLIQNFIVSPTVYLGGVAQTSGYTIDNHGTLTFTTAPASGVAVQWSGNFYYLCRFLDDEWTDMQQDLLDVWSNSALKFKSILV